MIKRLDRIRLVEAFCYQSISRITVPAILERLPKMVAETDLHYLSRGVKCATYFTNCAASLNAEVKAQFGSRNTRLLH